MKINPPPDPDTWPSWVKCPPGAIDSHIHLFGPADQYPIAPDTAYLTPDALPADLFRMHGVLGIERSVYVGGGVYGRNSRHVLDMLAAFPDRLRGVIVPPDALSANEITHMHELGVRGVRFSSHPRGRHLAPILPELAARVAERGWHVQFYSHKGGIAESAEALKVLGCTVVLDHFGSISAADGLDGAVFRTVLDLLDTGRFWVKLAAPMRCSALGFPYADLLPFARKLVEHAPERMVWGTDWPHPNLDGQAMPNDGGLLDLLGEWAPDEVRRNAILLDNPRTLYDFP